MYSCLINYIQISTYVHIVHIHIDSSAVWRDQVTWHKDSTRSRTGHGKTWLE